MLRVLAVRRVVEGKVLPAQGLGDLGGQRRIILHQQEFHGVVSVGGRARVDRRAAYAASFNGG